ncbi:hypothetical protein [Leucobacter aridicollis]|uniref:hypothetical protein n=1 Tax=Leucobacter aridicollis TaxID=283878 RepID=UPI0021046C13|nr:hypothetical protein [Leucobacter aridicollis]UTX53281.1 hypothetical protein KI794_00485 [Leucobacter aridicollis]
MNTLNTRQRITAFIDLAQALIEAIETEQATPLKIGTPAYQGNCRHHPAAFFPLRATRSGASEDTASHSHTAGSHYVEITQIPNWDHGLTRDEIDDLTTPLTVESRTHE